ncbi:hypothetical protein [Calycomorphotria hydatis]|uniref:Uncharacterized protein n=1 Tax=Calycomorphotria hydatis TaxID=2528027 RepID=A0A517TET1_9PLAN|nr:hypothetical protein [Calycomorphotria hydatis]QDT66881.1 hypothetical protein V22_41530 [Calycomorphotria hydatis]
MLTFLLSTLAVTSVVILVLVLVAAFSFWRKMPWASRKMRCLLLSLALLIPVGGITAMAIEPQFSQSGTCMRENLPEGVPEIFQLAPPESAMYVLYFKGLHHETYFSRLSREEFEKWRDKHQLEKDNGKLSKRPKFGTYLQKVPRAANAVYVPAGTGDEIPPYRVLYYESGPLLLYESPAK